MQFHNVEDYNVGDEKIRDAMDEQNHRYVATNHQKQCGMLLKFMWRNCAEMYKDVDKIPKMDEDMTPSTLILKNEGGHEDVENVEKMKTMKQLRAFE